MHVHVHVHVHVHGHGHVKYVITDVTCVSPQCAEGLRAAGMPDWLQLTGLIHDLGKMVRR